MQRGSQNCVKGLIRLLRDQAVIALDELEAERDGALEAKDHVLRALDDLSIERCRQLCCLNLCCCLCCLQLGWLCCQLRCLHICCLLPVLHLSQVYLGDLYRPSLLVHVASVGCFLSCMISFCALTPTAFRDKATVGWDEAVALQHQLEAECAEAEDARDNALALHQKCETELSAALEARDNALALHDKCEMELAATLEKEGSIRGERDLAVKAALAVFSLRSVFMCTT